MNLPSPRISEPWTPLDSTSDSEIVMSGASSTLTTALVRLQLAYNVILFLKWQLQVKAWQNFFREKVLRTTL